jgi:hypothetical protein
MAMAFVTIDESGQIDLPAAILEKSHTSVLLDKSVVREALRAG